MQLAKPTAAGAAKKKLAGSVSSGPGSAGGTPRSQLHSRRPSLRDGAAAASKESTPLARSLAVSAQQSMSESEASTYTQIHDLTEQARR